MHNKNAAAMESIHGFRTSVMKGNCLRMQHSSPPCLLLVEARTDKPSALQFLLSSAGYTVLIATSEDAAVACVSRERVHLVLIGEDFLAAHGYTLCTWLRRLFSLPIVVFAPLRHPDDLTTAFRLGVDDYIIKPVHHTLLLARLAAVLRRRRGSQARLRCKRSLLK